MEYSDTLLFRPAVPADFNRIWEIILQAKEQMRRENKCQWSEHYPAREHISADIANGYAHVLCREKSIIACGAVVFDGEPAYRHIRGKWLSDKPYVVVHRLAVADEAKRRGIAAVFMRETEKKSKMQGIRSFRVDTNSDNFYMQKLLTKLGFAYCGEITYPQGTRMAYEKLL